MQKVRHHLIRVGLKLIDERKSMVDVEEARLRWDDKRDYSLSPVESDLLSVLGRFFQPRECVSLSCVCGPIEYGFLRLSTDDHFRGFMSDIYFPCSRLRNFVFCAYPVSVCAGKCATMSEPSAGGDSHDSCKFSNIGRGYFQTRIPRLGRS